MTRGNARRPIRVLVVEDSTTVRQLLVQILSDAHGFEVVGEAANGVEAVEAACRLTPDLITMDVRMPIMDGLDATRQIMHEVPTPIVIVSDSVSRDDVNAALNATRAGALMLLPKPTNPLAPDFDAQRQQFLAMARAMAEVHVVRRWAGGRLATPTRVSRSSGKVAVMTEPSRSEVRLVAIATSTGGPAALQRILEDLPPDFAVPIVVVQHMAHGFLQGLADWLSDNTRRPVTLAASGELLLPGWVYLAPDDQHLGVTSAGRALLSDSAATAGFRPSADYLFHSCATAYGSSLLAVILTGMGQDGVDGLTRARQRGAHIIAQDEASSVVFGMARAAMLAGLPDEVLPLDRIGGRIGELAGFRATV